MNYELETMNLNSESNIHNSSFKIHNLRNGFKKK